MKHHVLHHVVSHTKRITHHLRQRRIVNRKTILWFLTFVNVIFIFTIGLNTLSFPNTYIGTRNVSFMTKSMMRTYLMKHYALPLRLSINAQNYDLSYEHIGIYMDPDIALQTIFTPNQSFWYIRIQHLFMQLVHPRVVHVPLSFSQEFYEYINKINTAGMSTTDIVYINQDNKQATLYALNEPYMVDLPLFQEKLRNHFGKSEEPFIVPLVETPNTLIEKVANANTNLARAYNSPLTVIVGLGDNNQFITLSPEDLRRYTTASIIRETGAVTFTLNNEKFTPDLTQALSVYKSSFNPNAAVERIGNGIKNALTTRFDGGPAESVKVGIDSGPNTEGEIADTYIEIDISQQKMFTFKNKSLVKTYRVSTGKDYPTPIGTFKILNKTGLGFSSIYNVWMPYWMAFEFSKELHAYFGIHELPYFYSGNQKIMRPREFIGAPNTGGCVALDVGDSKEVYQFADIGTPVVIYQ